MLQTSGLNVYDDTGVIHLKSIQVGWNERLKRQGSGSMANPGEQTWFWYDDLDRLKGYGCNCIEIHQIRWKDIMPTQDNIDVSWFTDWIDMWVNWCETREMYYILNICGLAPTSAYFQTYGPKMPSWVWTSGGFSEPTTEEEQADIVHAFWDTNYTAMDNVRETWYDTWAYIANRYKNNEYVLFGLINEPLAHTTDWMTSTTSEYLGEQYSIVIENTVDAIRAVGADHVISVDHPYVWYLANIDPVNRDNIMWEDHLYINAGRDITEWKSRFDEYHQRFTVDFGKPLFFGEYGIYPWDLWNTSYDDIWLATITEQVRYMNYDSDVCGKQFHVHSIIINEYFDYVTGGVMTEAEAVQLQIAIFTALRVGHVAILDEVIRLLLT